MRGSPILRTLAVLVFLALTGLALARLTREGEKPVAAIPSSDAGSTPAVAFTGHYRLILSAPASSIMLQGADRVQSGLEGSVTLEPGNPLVSLKIVWATTEPGHRFAKLVLDLPGRESLVHVFEAPGDIDDLWEIPQ